MSDFRQMLKKKKEEEEEEEEEDLEFALIDRREFFFQIQFKRIPF